MYRKGPPIALIRAADHRRRQAAKVNLSLCPTKLAPPPTTPAGRRLLVPPLPSRVPASPGRAPAEHRLSPPSRRLAGPPHPRSTTCCALCLASSRRAVYIYVRLCGGAGAERSGAGPTRVRARRRGGCCAGAGGARRRPPGGAVGPRMPPARGAVKSQGHKSALFFAPQGQGFRPSPSCHRHAAPLSPFPPPQLPAEAWPGWAASPPRPRGRPPDSICQRGLQRCTGIILLFLPLAPSPAANPLFNITETFIV